MSMYSDINTSKQEKFPLVTDIDAAWQSFINFLKTNKGERFFRPNLGSPLRTDLLFELEYEEAVFYAMSALVDAIAIWDPRIHIDEQSTIIELDYENQVVKLNIVFSVRGFEDKIIRRSFTL